MSRRLSVRVVAAFTASVPLVTLVAIAAGPQERAAQPARPIEKGTGRKLPPLPVSTDTTIGAQTPSDHLRSPEVDRLIETYDLKPHSLPSIPDDPPPHEGAMIDQPFPVEPPDMIQVEVLEALPGRPISGERLVQPDGTIDLGFYGSVHVRGLTPVQIKVAVIKQLRKYLPDDILGLVPDGEHQQPATEREAPPPAELAPDANPFGDPPRRKADPSASRRGVHPGAELQAGDPNRGDRTADTGKPVPPAESDRVFVYVTAYNSKNYYVLGDVLVPGRLPHTGNETILDVLQYAGGLLPTAEPKDIRLVRPGRNGKPSKVFNVDLEAIQDRGDVKSNFQILPGDRLVVGRNEVVKRTIELDRLAAPVQSVITSIQHEVTLLKSLGMQPDQGDRVLKDLVDFWSKELSRKGDLTLDEQTLRELLLRQLKPVPANPQPGGNPGPGAR